MITAASIDGVQIHLTPPNPNVCPIAISTIDGLGGSPAPKRVSTKRARAHGSVDSTRYYDDRVLQVAGIVWGPTMTALQSTRDQLMGLLALNGADHVLRFRREGFAEDEQVVFRVGDAVAIPLGGSVRREKWTAQLVCSDPRIYATALKLASYDPTVGAPGTGLLFPLAFPLSFGGTGTNDLVCSNQGNFPTPPVYTITGPVTNPIVSNDSTGLAIYTTGLALAGGDQLVIDVAKKAVTLNGGSRPDFIDAANTVWADLPAGDSLIRLQGVGMATGQTQLQVAWHDARI